MSIGYNVMYEARIDKTEAAVEAGAETEVVVEAEVEVVAESENRGRGRVVEAEVEAERAVGLGSDRVSCGEADGRSALSLYCGAFLTFA